jgi:tRNA (cytidine/uridine-2'-O-)-methyltransferase
MLHIVLHRPEIPQNSGNIGRLCALTRSRLHLIHPLGYTITDAKLRRAGMDYWHSLDVHHHDDFSAFQKSPEGPVPGRLWLLTTKATKTIWDADFADGDGLLFGSESCGVPDFVSGAIPPEFHVTIPQFDPALRSLNLSTAAGIAAYEALRQITRGK